MGNAPQQKPKHVLHYHRLEENKLWLFYPDSEMYNCFAIHTKAGPFFFGDMETIGIPSANAIFVIGGSGFRTIPQFVWTENPFNARMGNDGDEAQQEPAQAVPSLPVVFVSCRYLMNTGTWSRAMTEVTSPMLQSMLELKKQPKDLSLFQQLGSSPSIPRRIS